MLDTKNYKVVEFSWAEKRQDLFDGIAPLPRLCETKLRAPFALSPLNRPNSHSSSPLPAGKEIETAHFLIALDPRSGAIHRLRNKKRDANGLPPSTRSR